VVDLRTSSTWAEVLKTAIAVVGLLLSAGGIVFAGGQLVGEFKSFKAEVRSDVSDLREQVKKTAADSAAGNAAIAGQVKELNTKIGRLNLTRRNRSHGSAEDAPLPPTP
jgi:hypothetical protein